MENAAKALLIAAGILFALIILSLVVYMSTATTRMAEAQDEKVAAEQLAEFNRSYEAYNKRRMYGTDIITVVNKAINYNDKLTESETNKAINIEIELMEDFTATKKTIKEYANGDVEQIGDVGEIGEYSLNTKNGSLTLKIEKNTSNKIVDFFQEQSVNDEIKVMYESQSYIKKEIIYSALSNFKRAIFECEECEDTNSDGRIDYMKFKQYTSYKNY